MPPDKKKSLMDAADAKDIMQLRCQYLEMEFYIETELEAAVVFKL